MKSRTSLLFALSTLLLATTLTAAPESGAKGYRVSALAQPGSPTIEIGTSEFTVRRILGEPVRKLDPSAWVYDRYRALPSQSPNDNCRTLVITFNAGKVADLKLVNDLAEKVIAAQFLARPAQGEMIVAKR